MAHGRNSRFITKGDQPDRENVSQTRHNQQDLQGQIGINRLTTSGESEQLRNVWYSSYIRIDDQNNQQDENTLFVQNWHYWSYYFSSNGSPVTSLQYLNAINQQELGTPNERNGQIHTAPAQNDLNPPTNISYSYSSTHAGETQQYLNMAPVDNSHHMEANVPRNTQNIFTRIGHLSYLTAGRIWQHLKNLLLERIQGYYGVSTSRYQHSNIQSEQMRQDWEAVYNWYYPHEQVNPYSKIQNGQIRQDQNRQTGYSWQHPRAQTATSQQELNTQNRQVHQHSNRETGWQMAAGIRVGIRQYPQTQAATNDQESNNQNIQSLQQSNNQMNSRIIRRSTNPVHRRNAQNRPCAPSYALQMVEDRPNFRGVNRSSFPRIEMSQEEMSDLKCATCLKKAEELKSLNIPVGKTSCGHFYCIPCLYQWIFLCELCLVCRQPILRQPGEFRGFFIN